MWCWCYGWSVYIFPIMLEFFMLWPIETDYYPLLWKIYTASLLLFWVTSGAEGHHLYESFWRLDRDVVLECKVTSSSLWNVTLQHHTTLFSLLFLPHRVRAIACYPSIKAPFPIGYVFVNVFENRMFWTNHFFIFSDGAVYINEWLLLCSSRRQCDAKLFFFPE